MLFYLIEQENNINYFLEFHVYNIDNKNTQTEQLLSQLEKRISGFGIEGNSGTILTDNNNNQFTLFRLSKSFNNINDIYNFFVKDFKDLDNILKQIFKISKNFINIVITDTSNPPKQKINKSIKNINDYYNFINILNK